MVKSLGHRVLADWVFREVRSKAKLDYDPEVYPLAEDHLIVQLWLE